MFTECPECSTAFRVTAKVLQQAGGRVRCGGCGHAFSALEHLTEDMPGYKAEEGIAAGTTPAEEAAANDLTSEKKFKETSKQLLQTLSELTGADEVRIEDTGIEWAVVDDEEDEEGFAAEAAPTEAADAESESAEKAADLDELVGEDEQSGDFLELAEDDEEDAGIAAEAAPTAADSASELTLAADEPTDLAASQADDWNELIEDDEDTAVGDDIPLEVEEELAAIHSELSTKDDDEEAAPDNLDSQFEMQAEAMGIDISGSHEVAGDEDEGIEAEAASTEDAATEDEAPAEVDEDKIEAIGTGEQISLEGDAVMVENAAPDDAEEDKEQIAAAFTPDAEVIELSLANAGAEASTEHEPEYSESVDVPELSEEELTINQEIDQELLAVASQDDDLRATIVGLDKVAKETGDEDEEDEEDEEPGPEVETIIMEGDQIRGAFEREREKERREAALKRFDKAGNLIDSYVARRIVRGGRRSSDPLGYGMIAGVALLVLVLFGQVVHANRQSFSTSGLFNQTIGHVYRMLGNPITPEWSITGWQFEATNGSVAEDEDVLTIFSRIGNRSEQALPYPLLHVSLTDRWEEIIGSAILDPGDYLAADVNPNQPVSPGGKFTAVITIDEPSVDATGFKLNVCYRVSPGRVRCATEDFKD